MRRDSGIKLLRYAVVCSKFHAINEIVTNEYTYTRSSFENRRLFVTSSPQKNPADKNNNTGKIKRTSGLKFQIIFCRRKRKTKIIIKFGLIFAMKHNPIANTTTPINICKNNENGSLTR